MKVYDFEQHDMQGNSNPDWLAVRSGKFTGSDFYIMLKNGETKRKMILEKATEQILGHPCDKDRFLSRDMIRGIELEPVARQKYMEQTQTVVKEVGFVEKDKYSGCSPDGLVGEDGLIEIKCPRDTVFVEQFVSRKIKLDYFIQIQYNLYITGRQWCDYIAYNENFPSLFIQRYERDEETINNIKEALKEGISDVKTIVSSFFEQ